MAPHHVLLFETILIGCLSIMLAQSLELDLVKNSKDPTKFDIAIRGYDEAKFHVLSGDKLRIHPKQRVCILMNTKGKCDGIVTWLGEADGQNMKFLGIKWIEFEAIQKIQRVEKTLSISKEEFVRSIFEHKVAVLENSMSSTADNEKLSWRLIVPQKPSGKAHPDREDIKIQYDQTKHKLLFTNLDLKAAGFLFEKWNSNFRTCPGGVCYSLVSTDGKATNDFDSSTLYLYEASKVDHKPNWVQYVFENVEQLQKKRRKSYYFLHFRDIHEGVMGNRGLYLTPDDLIYRAARGLIAFDPEGEYLMIGEKNKNEASAQLQKTANKKKKKVRFNLGEEDRIVAAKYGMLQNDDAYYYDEYYYEDMLRLLRLLRN